MSEPIPPEAEAVVVALMTVPDAAVGEALARALVGAGLAACVNLVPGLRSVYRWEGGVAVDDELLLIIKTTADRVGAAQAAALAAHPYTLPEFVVLPTLGGHAAYLDWVRQSTRPGLVAAEPPGQLR